MPNSVRLVSDASKEMIFKAIGLRKKCKSQRRLDGKVVVITGANTGIGKETALQLSFRGPKIYICCRDLTKAESAINDIKNLNPNANITALKLDLSSLKSVRHLIEKLYILEPVIDILVNNAGVVATPEWKTADGFEMQFATNHLGHFLLTLSLMPLLRKSSNARIINVSSALHIIGTIHLDNINLRNGAYAPMKAHAQSKLANVLFTRELAKRLGKDSPIRVYSLNPGAVKTEALRHFTSGSISEWFQTKLFMSPEMGAQTTLYCALEESLDNESGFYYDNCKRIDDMVSEATDDKTAERLWDLSCDLVALNADLKRMFSKSPVWSSD